MNDPAESSPGESSNEGGRSAWLRRKAVSAAIEIVLRSASNLGKLHPRARFIGRGVRVQKNLRYADGAGSARLLDIYRHDDFEGSLPVIVFVHGGGFRILSKDTHWMFARELARRGYLVFSVNYRLALPFPNGLEDVVQAVNWVHDNAESFGGDLDRLVYAGESAGANLISAVTMMHCTPRPEPFAQTIWNLEHRPKAILPLCGMLQASKPERYLEQTDIPLWMRDRISAVCRGYLPDTSGGPDAHALADPLVWLETTAPPARPLPAIFSSCGTNDPVVDDTRRLKQALTRFDTPSEVRLYEGGMHAFQAVIWSELTQQAWRDQDAFLERVGLPGRPPSEA